MLVELFETVILGTSTLQSLVVVTQEVVQLGFRSEGIGLNRGPDVMGYIGGSKTTTKPLPIDHIQTGRVFDTLSRYHGGRSRNIRGLHGLKGRGGFFTRAGLAFVG